MPVTDVVRVRTDLDAKERVAAALADMGLSLSDAIRLLMVGAGERRFPSVAKAPDAIARKAELEGRQARAFARIADFVTDLHDEGD